MGTVVDPSGAAVVSGAVMVISKETGAKRKAMTTMRAVLAFRN